MEQSEREWLQRELDALKGGQDDIKAGLEGKPCAEHGERLASLESGKKSRLDWTKIGVSVWMIILTAALVLLAFGEYKK